MPPGAQLEQPVILVTTGRGAVATGAIRDHPSDATPLLQVPLRWFLCRGGVGVKLKLYGLSMQHECEVFVGIRESENHIMIVHLVGRYVAPVGKELDDPDQNGFFLLKGDYTKSREPQLVHFSAMALR